MVLAVAHPNPSLVVCASFYLPSQSLADSRCNLHATSRRPTLVVLSLVASSSERVLAIPNNSNTHTSFGAWSPCRLIFMVV